jgi:hypothetical protein
MARMKAVGLRFFFAEYVADAGTGDEHQQQ